MRQLATRVKRKQELTTTSHCKAFNYDQNPYRIVSNKTPQNYKCKLIPTGKNDSLVYVDEKEI